VSPIVSIRGFTEPFSSLSHLGGALVFAVLAAFVIYRGRGDALRMASLVVFGLGTVLLLTTSGVYHLLEREGMSRLVMQRVDHAAIFVLIACSFTPIHVILFRGKGRWGMLALIWFIAVAGITVKTLYFNQINQTLGTGMYIGMGWIGLGAWLAVVRRHGFRFAQPVMWGGFAYTIGGILAAVRWPTVLPGVIQAHEVFHVAVLVGLACHWAFIYAIADWPLATGDQESRSQENLVHLPCSLEQTADNW